MTSFLRFGAPRRPVACAILAAVSPLSPPALAAPEITFTQLTEAGPAQSAWQPSISADGRLIAFAAAADYLGTNPEGNVELFLYDTDDGALLQLTSTPGGFSHFEPMITPDGGVVAFRSLVDYTGGNPDFSFEIWSVDVETLAITQLTDSPAGSIMEAPAMSADGEWIVFPSTSNGLGANPEFNREIFRLHRSTAMLEQLTFTPIGVENLEPAVSVHGDVVFRSTANIDGANPEGNFELCAWSPNTGVHALTTTPADAMSEQPAIGAAGDVVAFLSAHDFTGGNPDGGREIFLMDLVSGAITQVTTPGPSDHLGPILTPDAAALYFESMRNLTGANPDGNRELFRYDLAAGGLDQVTSTTGGASVVTVPAQGRTRYVASAADACVIAHRSEHALEIDWPNPGANFEIFRGDLLAVGDLTGDCRVSPPDLAALLAAWGPCAPACDADLDDNGVVDIDDLQTLLSVWTG